MQTITFKGSDIAKVHDRLLVVLKDGRVLDLAPEVVLALLSQTIEVTCCNGSTHHR